MTEKEIAAIKKTIQSLEDFSNFQSFEVGHSCSEYRHEAKLRRAELCRIIEESGK